MKKRMFLVVAVLGLLVLTPSAFGLKYCGDCEGPWDPDNCVGSCNGQLVRGCALWFQLGCPTFFQPPELSAEEVFLTSLAEPAEAVEEAEAATKVE